MCTMKCGTCAAKANCCCWSMPQLEWYIHNELQLAKVGLIEIPECCSALDWRSPLYLNFNERPGHIQHQKLQLSYEYPSHVSVSDILKCRSEVYPNNHDIPAQAAGLPWISEHMCPSVIQKLNNRVECVDCRTGLAILQSRSWRYLPRTLWCTWTWIKCQP